MTVMAKTKKPATIRRGANTSRVQYLTRCSDLLEIEIRITGCDKQLDFYQFKLGY